MRELGRIPVFDRGRIVEDGNHAVLMRIKSGIHSRRVSVRPKEWRWTGGGVTVATRTVTTA